MYQLACQDPQAPDFTDPDPLGALEAGAICASCPVANACLVTAQQLHDAHRAGRDPYGVYGCWAGWWYQPNRSPRPILQQPVCQY